MSSTFDVVNPSDGSVIATLPNHGASEAHAAARRAAAAQASWAATPLLQRSKLVAAIADYILERRETFVELALEDVGAVRAIAGPLQVDGAIDRIRQTAAFGPSVFEATVQDARNLHVDVIRAPVGPTACIAPFNFPLLAMVAKIAPALVAGNTVVMKPAPQDPLMVLELEQACRAVGFPDGVVNLVVGDDASAGAALVDAPEIAMVSFTGSTSVGRSIYASGADTMKRLMLELGGKGALIIADRESLEPAIAGATRTFAVHSGQICVTPSRVVVGADLRDDAIELLREAASRQVLGDARDPAVTMGPLVSRTQQTRVNGMLDRARASGAEVWSAGEAPATGFFVAPSVVSACSPSFEIAQEEVFGPVVTVLEADGDEEAIAVANSTVYGLQDYVYCSDHDRASAIARRLRSGGVGINTTTRHPGAPFGGTVMSGVGRSGGEFALQAYTELRAFVSPVLEPQDGEQGGLSNR